MKKVFECHFKCDSWIYYVVTFLHLRTIHLDI